MWLLLGGSLRQHCLSLLPPLNIARWAHHEGSYLLFTLLILFGLCICSRLIFLCFFLIFFLFVISFLMILQSVTSKDLLQTLPWFPSSRLTCSLWWLLVTKPKDQGPQKGALYYSSQSLPFHFAMCGTAIQPHHPRS